MVKMGFLTSGVFWGVILILLGLSVVLKALFHIDIPLFRIIFALVIIYLGVRVLVGGFGGISSEGSVILGENDLRPVDGRQEYAVVFGKGTLDLGDLGVLQATRKLQYSTIFGAGRLIIPRGVPVRIKVTAAFGNARLPNGNTLAFGSQSYSQNWVEGRPGLEIEATLVFGELIIQLTEGPGQAAPESAPESDGPAPAEPPHTGPSV